MADNRGTQWHLDQRGMLRTTPTSESCDETNVCIFIMLIADNNVPFSILGIPSVYVKIHQLIFNMPYVMRIGG